MHRLQQASVTLLLLAGMVSLQAQVTDPGWKPSLGEAFPLALKDTRVVLTEAVLVTPNQVLPAGTLARNVFTLPDAKAVQKANKVTKIDQLDETYASKRTKISAIDPEADPRDNYEKAVDSMAAAPPWSQVEKFAAFFHIAQADSYMFSYQTNAESPPRVVQFRLPERLLLSEADGAVKVRAVGIGSAAERAGLPPGVLLVRVGDADLEGSLQKFIKVYPVEKEKAQLAGHPLALAYRAPGGGELKTVELRVPISLKSKAGLFDEIPTDTKPKAPPEQKPGTPQVETMPVPAP